MSRPVVHLHMETLVLEGFSFGSPGSGARVADGVERELRRLIAESVPSGWERGVSVDYVRGPAVMLSPSAGPERVGEKIAASIYRTAAREDGP